MIAPLDSSGDSREDWRKLNEVIAALNSLESIAVQINTPQYNFMVQSQGVTQPVLLHIAPTKGKFHVSSGSITLELT